MEGYWLTRFRFGTTLGQGIAMLHDGELVGGDFEHIWSGTYEEDGPRVHATIRVIPSVSTPEQILARDQPIILILSGYCSNEFARLEGYRQDRRELRYLIEMRKCK